MQDDVLLFNSLLSAAEDAEYRDPAFRSGLFWEWLEEYEHDECARDDRWEYPISEEPWG